MNEYGYNGKRFDSAVGLADYGFRDYAPQIGRFTTLDPIKDGSNWYVYVGNDPVNFIDPIGLTPSDSGAANQNPYATQTPGVPPVGTTNPYADKPSTPLDVAKKVQDSINEHLDEPYIKGKADCDIYLRDRYKDAGYSDSTNPIQNPEGTSVPQHKERLGEGNSELQDGNNIHIKDGHVSNVNKNDDGSYDASHQGYNLTEKSINGKDTNEYSATYHYNDENSFKDSFWGDGTYY